MRALLEPESLDDLPAVRAWLAHAEATRRIIKENYQHLPDGTRLMATIQENVLVQLESLRTHPAVAVRLSRGNLRLHGWVYKMETDEIFAFDPGHSQYVPVNPQRGAANQFRHDHAPRPRSLPRRAPRAGAPGRRSPRRCAAGS